MCDAEWGGLQPQQSQNNVILAPPDPSFPNFAGIGIRIRHLLECRETNFQGEKHSRKPNKILQMANEWKHDIAKKIDSRWPRDLHARCRLAKCPMEINKCCGKC